MSISELQAFIEGCLEAGADIFDHADIYGDYSTEAEFGVVLKGNSSLRDSMLLISKCGIMMPANTRPHIKLKSYDTSREHIVQSVEQSLENLATDRLDLLLIHRPDMLMDPTEIAEAFEVLRNSGKVIAFGVSNFTASQIRALHSCWPDLLVNQIELSPTHRDPFLDGTLDQCLEWGMRPMAWSPMAGGQLFQRPEIMKVLEELARKYGVAADTLIYAWLMRHPSNPMPVTGSSKIERIKSALEAAELEISREDWYAIWTAAGGQVP